MHKLTGEIAIQMDECGECVVSVRDGDAEGQSVTLRIDALLALRDPWSSRLMRRRGA
jgi:hypothetical protein